MLEILILSILTIILFVALWRALGNKPGFARDNTAHVQETVEINSGAITVVKEAPDVKMFTKMYEKILPAFWENNLANVSDMLTSAVLNKLTKSYKEDMNGRKLVRIIRSCIVNHEIEARGPSASVRFWSIQMIDGKEDRVQDTWNFISYTNSESKESKWLLCDVTP